MINDQEYVVLSLELHRLCYNTLVTPLRKMI
jgi:hypothetical protein